MAADVRLHGDMVEFLLNQRCEACRQRDRKCLIQQRDERCLLCTDADRRCIFTRTIVVAGARTGFEWDVLLGKELIASVNQDYRAMAGLMDGNMRCVEKTMSHARGRWYRAFILCRVLSAFQSAGQKNDWSHPEDGKSHNLNPLVLAKNFPLEDPLEREKEIQGQFSPFHDSRDSSFGCFALTPSSTEISQSVGKTFPGKTMIEKKPRRRRCFSKQEKERINQVRKTGACQSCRRKRRKCWHVSLEHDGGSPSKPYEPELPHVSENSPLSTDSHNAMHFARPVSPIS